MDPKQQTNCEMIDQSSLLLVDLREAVFVRSQFREYYVPGRYAGKGGSDSESPGRD